MSGSNRVIRGGSWNNNPANVRVANRNNNSPENRNNNLGFRLANTALSGMPASTDTGSVNELSSRLSCMPPGGIEYQPGSPRLVVLRKAGAAFSFHPSRSS